MSDTKPSEVTRDANANSVQRLVGARRLELKWLKLWPFLSFHLKDCKVRIWSAQWQAWWREGGHGYTTQVENAGIFDFKDALKMSKHAGPEKQIEYVEAV